MAGSLLIFGDFVGMKEYERKGCRQRFSLHKRPPLNVQERASSSLAGVFLFDRFVMNRKSERIPRSLLRG
jgi:hypothetical protein